jgi:superfamily II DNA or RNA helicase
MTEQSKVQEIIKDKLIKEKFRGIMLAAVRVGKTRIILETIKKHSKGKDITIFLAYPNIDIKKSWEDEMDKINYHPNIIYSTFISLEKFKDIKADYCVFDEAHLLPEENIVPIMGYIVRKNKYSLLASGTYSDSTLENLKDFSGMDLIIDYPLEKAIEAGIINDFTIKVHKYMLNASKPIEFGKTKKWFSTDYKECARLSKKIIFSSGEQKMFASLNRMRFINSCDSLTTAVNNWINQNKDKRFLLFTGDENVGKKYDIPMFNSKSKNDDVLKDFQNGTINQLCLIKKGSAGITYPNLQHVLITAINSNGENLEQMLGRSLLQDTENAEIHIFVSTEDFQNKWLNSSLESINKSKIKYINI